MSLHLLTKTQRLELLERTVVLFEEFCLEVFKTRLYRYQKRIARACLSSLLVERKNVYIKISRQAGKCLAKGTPILMFDGSIKPVEEIRVGDLLMGDDSTPRRVLSLARGRERMWRVQPNSNGHEPYVVNESHILTVACRRTGRIYDRPLRSILSLKEPENCVLGVKAAVAFPTRPVPIDPYWLGLWLGDGVASGVGITTADHEVVSYLWNYAGELGMVLSVYPEKNASDTYAITHGYGNRRGLKVNPLQAAIHEMGLFKNKHIPDLYRVNSEDVRLKLLAGLIDSDGHRPSAPGKENVCEFVFVSRRLALDVQWLARSLGFRASIALKMVNGAEYWRVMLYGELWRVPTKIKRKQYVKTKLRENPLSYGFTLVDEGDGDYYGFEIDGNKRFLLGDCTVTHNTELVTLLIKMLLVFLLHLRQQRLMLGIASPNGEQAKTDVDRLKLSLGKGQPLHDAWELEDTENNAKTMRVMRRGVLQAEVFVFSLAPTTNNESKTLNVLVVEEAHKINDQKCDDELVPMLSSTGGVSWRIGVGCTRLCDFKRGCDGQLPETEAIVVPVDEVIADRRAMYEETGDPSHLAYESWFKGQLEKYGRNNPEIRRNFYLEDTVEEGNFISRERLRSCARPKGAVVPTEQLYCGIDWARESDHTWVALVNGRGDLVDMFKYPHGLYQQQVQLMQADLTRKHKGKKPDGTEYEWTYLERIVSVRGDDTGAGGPMEILQQNSSLPVGKRSCFKFTMQSKDELYTNFEQALFMEAGKEGRFSYDADHPLASEFEEQMARLVREYKGDGEYLSVHHPEGAGEHDDAPDAVALALLASKTGQIGSILFA